MTRRRQRKLWAVTWQEGGQHGIAGLYSSRTRALSVAEELTCRAIALGATGASIKLESYVDGKTPTTFLENSR